MTAGIMKIALIMANSHNALIAFKSFRSGYTSLNFLYVLFPTTLYIGIRTAKFITAAINSAPVPYSPDGISVVSIIKNIAISTIAGKEYKIVIIRTLFPNEFALG